MNSKIKTLLVLYVGLLSILIRGYFFGLGDQVINLPLIFKTQDLSLYPQDLLFSTQPEKLAFFYPAIGKLITLSGNIQTTLLAIYTLCIILFFYITSKLARELQNDGLAWFISLLFFILPYHIGGSAIMTVESSLAPRTVGNVFSLVILYLIFKRKYIASFLVLGLAILAHPLSALSAGIILYSHLLFVSQGQKIKTLVFGSLILLVYSTPLWVRLLPQFSSTESVSSSKEWLNVLKLRNSYAFAALWKFRGWLSLVLGIIPLTVYLTFQSQDKKQLDFQSKTLLNILATSFGILLLQLFFTSVYPLSSVIKLQLGRIWFLPITLSFICLSLLIDKLRELLGIKEKIFLIFTLILLTVVGVFNAPQFLRTQDPQWRDTQIWANKHTSGECAFLVPFASEGFRVFSQRPTTGEYKDGTLSFYSSDFAREWKQRLDDLSSWEETDDKTIEKLQKKYQFSFIVSDTYSSDSLELVHTNSKYRVFSMPTLATNCRLTY